MGPLRTEYKTQQRPEGLRRPASGIRGPPSQQRDRFCRAVPRRVKESLLRWMRPLHDASGSHPRLAAAMVGLFTTAYFAATCWMALLKPFSFDELTTYNIARQPTATGVWRAWLEAGDAMPPVVHFATRLAGSLLGFSHITARLPAMLGFWLMCVCIFVFLRRRVCPALAGVGMLLPMTVPLAYSYAYEARGYGLVLGLSGAAVVCWDLADAPPWRRTALIGLPICLAAAVATHLYAVLLVFPLALAELGRNLERRRPDWWVWGGLASVAFVILPTNPLVAHIRSNPQLLRFAAGPRVSVSALMQVWGQFLSVAVTYLGLLALACLGRGRGSRAEAPELPTPERRLADWGLAVGLMAIPAAAWLLANVVTGLLLFRYVLATVIGFSVAVPLLYRVAVGRRPELALLAAGWVAVTAVGSILDTRHVMRTTGLTTEHIAAGRGCFALLNLWTRLPPDDSPIVVSDFYVFHQVHHYAPEALRRRLVFLVDREFGGLIEPYMSFYERVFGQRMETFEGFLRSSASFHLYDCGSSGRLPLPAMLLRAGASLRDSGLGEIPDVLALRDLYRVFLTGDATGGGLLR
jgi:hypothetical protein